MPNIKCITPGCPHWISDPCIKTNSLFQIHTDLMERLENTPGDKDIMTCIYNLDSIMESELGFQDVQARYQIHKKAAEGASEVHLFTLICVLGHKNQYQLKCS